MKTLDIAKALHERKDRSAWNKGVTAYALEMIEEAHHPCVCGEHFFSPAAVRGLAEDSFAAPPDAADALLLPRPPIFYPLSGNKKAAPKDG